MCKAVLMVLVLDSELSQCIFCVPSCQVIILCLVAAALVRIGCWGQADSINTNNRLSTAELASGLRDTPFEPVMYPND